LSASAGSIFAPLSERNPSVRTPSDEPAAPTVRSQPLREHLIVHQFDPLEQIAGGVHGFLIDLVRYAPPEHVFRFMGVDGSGSSRLGRWRDVTVAGRPARFLPVARLSAGRQQRRVPHAMRLIAGMLARRPWAGNALLHAHLVEVGAVLELLYPKRPVVQFVHTDFTAVRQHRAESFWRYLPRAQLAVEHAAVRRAERTFVMSRAAADRLRTQSSRVTAWSNWFDDETFHPRGADREHSGLVVGWVGRLEPSKNPLEAVEVFSRLAERDPSFKGWFAGTGTLERDLRDRVQALGLADRVELLGTIGPSALAERLRRSACLLVTSLWEGQPRAVLEALACGTPVVSTKVGDVEYFVRDGETGFVSGTRTAEDLALLVEAAGKLRDRTAISASVAGRSARVAVPQLFEELSRLRAPRRREA
jgi:glycosyltransferase involved in cell wall biosynthesis